MIETYKGKGNLIIMSKFEKLKNTVSEKLVPAMTRLGQIKFLQALSSGMIMTLPLTLGAAIFSILGSFPVPAVATFFQEVGLADQFKAISGGTLDILALFITVGISYHYALLLKSNAIMSVMFSLATFFILSPQQITVGEETVGGFLSSNLGSAGLFVAMIVAISISGLFTKLSNNKKLLFKMPETVPPMVAKSFEPIFVGIIILVLVFLVRLGFSMTAFGNIFSFVNEVVAKPLVSIGGSVPALFLVYTLASFLFFFGIHPNAIVSVIIPVFISMLLTSIDQFNQGQPLQYLNNLVVFDFMNNDGTGSTLSLMICILLFGKSKRYKAFAKIATVPNIFNINEPVIFGFPIMLNPIMFIPFVLSSAISGFIGLIALKLQFITYYNPTLSGLVVPWTVPKIISSFLTMGWQGVVLRIFIMFVLVFVYYPFFKVLDNQEIREEEKLANE